MADNFLPPEGLSIPDRLGRLATLGLLVQRLALDGTPDGKDFIYAVGSIIAQEAAELAHGGTT